MAENVSIVIRAVNKTKGVFGRIGRASKRMTAGISKDFSKIGGLLGGLGLAVGGAALIKGLIGANVEFQNLQVRLQTFTGDAASAAAVFKQLTKFAAETPFELQDSVNAFIDLRAIGIEPTEESLGRLADVAAAMGGSIVDLSGAIRAAVRGELDPLERFAGQMVVVGDQIKGTFAGQVTMIDRTAIAITRYVEQIAQTGAIAGGAKRQMDTLGGAISNMKDNFFQLATTIGEGGLGDILMAGATRFNKFLEMLRSSPALVEFWVKAILAAFKVMGVAAWNFAQITFRVGLAIGNLMQAEFEGIKVAWFTLIQEIKDGTSVISNIITHIPVIWAANKISGDKLIPGLPDVADQLLVAQARMKFFAEETKKNFADIGEDAIEGLAPLLEMIAIIRAGPGEDVAKSGEDNAGLKKFGQSEELFRLATEARVLADEAAKQMKIAMTGMAVGGDIGVASTERLRAAMQRLQKIVDAGSLKYDDQVKALRALKAAQMALDSQTSATIAALGQRAGEFLGGLELGGDLAEASLGQILGVMADLNLLIADGTLKTTDRIAAQEILNELILATGDAAKIAALAQEASVLVTGLDSSDDALARESAERLLEIRDEMLEKLDDEKLVLAEKLALTLQIQQIDEAMLGSDSGVDAIFNAIKQGATEANFAVNNLGDGLGLIAGTTLASFGAAWGEAFGMAGEGADKLGEAVKKGVRKGVAGAAKAKSMEAAIDAAKALAEGLTNPVKLAQAAKLFAVSAAYGALAGKLGGGGGGGPAGAGGLTGGLAANTENAAGDGAGGLIVIQGGLVNMDDPRQAQAFEDAVNRLAGAGRIEIVGA